MRVLLVDDEPNVLRALEREMRPLGHIVRTAPDGHAALEAIRRSTPDVLITDIRMPVMDGFELLRALGDDYPDLVRIVLSGYADLRHATEVVREGLVDHFLTKPWERDQVLGCLQEGARTRTGRTPVTGVRRLSDKKNVGT